MKKIGVIGAGSWGTALAVTLANKGHQVKIWAHRVEHVAEMKADRENVKYLPGVRFAETLQPVDTLEEALEDADMALFSVPAQAFRSNFEKAIPYLEDKTIVVNVAKGIERGTLMRLSEIASILKPDVKYVVLSGPSHAEEVGKAMPTTVAVASENIQLAEAVQDMFMTDRFRVYTNEDVCGTELGGALKNIIALASGIALGLGYGDNTKAALITRGMHEIAQLGKAMGCDERTFYGLAGIGDLIVTATSVHSRNNRCGHLIGEGMNPADAVKKVGMVVEGINCIPVRGH